MVELIYILSEDIIAPIAIVRAGNNTTIAAVSVICCVLMAVEGSHTDGYVGQPWHTVWH